MSDPQGYMFVEAEATDEVLVRRARRGDAHAFDLLVERHYAGCLRYAGRMLGNRADAEEAVQDAFLRVYRALPRYQERQRFRPWLLRILANRCRTSGLRQAWRRARLLAYGELAPRSNGGPPQTELNDELQRALAKLPDLQREAFLLKHVEELSYDEMMKVTGDSESALKMRVKRACAALEAMLKDAL